MKWDSLNYTQQNRLRAIYDERHAEAKPEKPGDFTPPEAQPRKAIPVSYSTDIYTRMTTVDNRHQPREATGQIRLVGSTEHINIDLPAEAIPRLIEELQKLHADMTAYNEAAAAHKKAEAEARTAKEEYDTRRDSELAKALADGKHTQYVIVNEPDKIPF